MASFGQQRQHSNNTEKEARDRVDRAHTTPDPVASQLIALQQSAGNAAVSRLVARSRMLQRQDGGAPPPAAAPAAPAAPAASTAAAPAAGGNDALLAMTRVAWETGVAQRERDAAAALRRPGGHKRDMQDAMRQLVEASGAIHGIGEQLGAVDPNRRTRASVHHNAVFGLHHEIKPLEERVTPGQIAGEIETDLLAAGDRTIADLTAPISAPAGGGSAPATPAPYAGPAGFGSSMG